jgi:hypothetical protein
MSVRPPYHAPPAPPTRGVVTVHAGFSHPKRPIGITVLSVLVLLIGVGAIIIGLIVFLAPSVSNGAINTVLDVFGENFFNLGLIGGIALFLGGFILVNVAQGLWHQELWSLVLCAAVIFLAEAVIFFFFLPFTYLWFALLILFVYLLAVRKSFS